MAGSLRVILQFVAAQCRWPIRLEFRSGHLGIDGLCIEFDAGRKCPRPAGDYADHEVYAAFLAESDVLSQAHGIRRSDEGTDSTVGPIGSKASHQVAIECKLEKSLVVQVIGKKCALEICERPACPLVKRKKRGVKCKGIAGKFS